MNITGGVSQSNNTLIIDGSGLRADVKGQVQKSVDLKAGSTIQGRVVSISDTEEGKIANINVGDSVISARLQDGMGLREGQVLNFAVRGSSQSSVTITPLFENTSPDQSTLKALQAAGLEINNDNIQMVKEMMQAGLPINKNAILDMGKNLQAFPNNSISTMVEMKSLGIPINSNNLTQFESYKNYEHQVTTAMESIMDELPAAFDTLMAQGDQSKAMALYGSVLKLFGGADEAAAEQALTEGEAAATSEAASAEAGEEVLLTGDESKTEASNNADGTKAQLTADADTTKTGQTVNADGSKTQLTALAEESKGQLTTGADKTAVQETLNADSSRDTTALQGKYAAKEADADNAPIKAQTKTIIISEDGLADKSPGRPASVSKDIPTVISDKGMPEQASARPLNPNFVNTLKNLGISDEAIKKYSENPKTETAQKELLKELANAFEDSDLSNPVESASWKKIFSSDDYNRLLKDNISSQWHLKPGDVEKKENIESLYQRLGNQVKGLTTAVNQNLGAESRLSQAANNLQNNLDFMNQLNQMFQYVQLPLQMAGQNANGDLYVYRNKNKKMNEDGSVSAVLHLDMDNLGPVDVYVKMIETKVTTNFYVEDESVLDLINDNIHILNERLEKRGYSMNVKLMLLDDMDGQDAAVDEMLSVSKTQVISTNSFDARA